MEKKKVAFICVHNSCRSQIAEALGKHFFFMESGVRMLLKDLRGALDRGVHIRILTGNYLGITQPSALYLIRRELGDSVDLRFYNDKNRSFHPKAYIFHYGENASRDVTEIFRPRGAQIEALYALEDTRA